MMMTDERLAEIEARVAAATSGPWKTTGGQLLARPDADDFDSVLSCCNTDDGTLAFIAHARDDIPDLIAEVRRLRAPITSAEEAFGAYLDPTSSSGTVGETIWIVGRHEGVYSDTSYKLADTRRTKASAIESAKRLLADDVRHAAEREREIRKKLPASSRRPPLQDEEVERMVAGIYVYEDDDPVFDPRTAYIRLDEAVRGTPDWWLGYMFAGVWYDVYEMPLND